MSVLDRLHKAQAEEMFQPIRELSSCPEQGDNAVVIRLKNVFRQLHEYTTSTSQTGKAGDRLLKGSYILQAVMEEVFEELKDVDEPMMSQWFVNFGDIIRWVGSGDINDLPEQLRQFAQQDDPTPAITAG